LSGVYIYNAPNNVIGGTTVGARNVISANLGGGIVIEGSGATGNLMQGNYIGTNAAGTCLGTVEPVMIASQFEQQHHRRDGGWGGQRHLRQSSAMLVAPAVFGSKRRLNCRATILAPMRRARLPWGTVGPACISMTPPIT
jgi:hypothetical protein